MKRFNLEVIVGLFVVVGVACFAYIAIKLGGLNPLGEETYRVDARFRSIAGLNKGAVVEIAGVRVGTVARINLDPDDYDAVVQLAIVGDVQIHEDSIASIRSTGIIGDKFVNITPGGADAFLKPGDEIVETESSVSLEELISKYIFEK